MGDLHRLCCLIPLILATLATAAETVTAAPAVEVTLRGTVTPQQEADVVAALERARQQGVGTLLLTFDQATATRDTGERLARLLLAGAEKPRPVAWVTGRATQGAALAVYACPAVFLAPSATVGGIADDDDDGKAALRLREVIFQISQKRGWSRAVLHKMADPKARLFEYRPEGAARTWVLDEDAPRFEADHPELDAKDPRRKVLIADAGRTLVRSGGDLVDLGLASGLAADLATVRRSLGLPDAPAAAAGVETTTPTAGTTPTVATAAAKTPSKPRPGTYGKVGWIDVDTRDDKMIDQHTKIYLERALDHARDQGLQTVIVRIRTYGGQLFSGEAMMSAVLDQTVQEKLHTIAWVDDRAISAGAMIAYGHREVWIAPQATIGDIGVIMMGQDGKIEYGPEKIETTVRELLRRGHDICGWNEAKLVKMTARNQELFEYRHADGRRVSVLEDDVPLYEADHPDIDPTDKNQKVQIRGKDRLLTYTGTDAVKDGMATGLAKNRDDLLTQLGIAPADVTEILPTANENIAWALADWAPLLAALAALFIVLELKTPGVGIFAVLAGICGLAFLVCQFYLEMASAIELILILAGLALVVTELLTGIGGGLLGLGGALLALVGLLLAFIPDAVQGSPSDPEFGRFLGSAVMQSALAVVVAAVGMVFIITTLPSSRFGRRLAMAAEITATASVDESDLNGRPATTVGALRPAGRILLDGVERSARTEHGEFVEPGQAVQVVGSVMGELVVRPVAAAPDKPVAS